MKLLTKTILYIVTLSLFLFFIMGIIFFQILKRMSMNELQRDMIEMREAMEVNMGLLLDNRSFELPGIDSFSVVETKALPANYETFTDTLLLDKDLGEYRTFQVYTFTVQYDETLYKAEIYRSTTPYDKLVERVTFMMTGMMILFVSGIFLLNRFIFSNLWKDFFSALDKLKRFDVEKEAIRLEDSDIEEFSELNRVLGKMTSRLSKDYKELKDHSDHTSHELQTPLAIIKSRIEILLQSNTLTKNEIELLRDIYANADHLSRLNSTLAILTRIENRQFRDIEQVNISKLLVNHLEMLHELIGLKNITVNSRIPDEEVIITMDSGLADVLVINLLKNAIIHNIDNGKINIELNRNRLIVSNTGINKCLQADKIFNRFYRGTKKKNGFGLGLSLVKKICDFYNFPLHYSFEDEMHHFHINFNNEYSV